LSNGRAAASGNTPLGKPNLAVMRDSAVIRNALDCDTAPQHMNDMQSEAYGDFALKEAKRESA
jgi:hypothetical protein